VKCEAIAQIKEHFEEGGSIIGKVNKNTSSSQIGLNCKVDQTIMLTKMTSSNGGA